MPEQSDPSAANDIEELARRLREAEHLEPEAREQVADLLGDLAAELDQTDQHEPGMIEAAKDHLEEAVARAEAKAPVATDLVLQLIDLLATLGI
jgi:hypothetical protein